MPRPDVKVLLREIPCRRRFELSPSFVAEAVATMPMRVALERPDEDPDAGGGSAEVELYSEGDNVFARGQMDGWVEVACSRCVGPARLPVAESLQVTFMPAGQVPVEADEADEPVLQAGDVEAVSAVTPGDEDLDLYPYSGEEVDLAPLFREQIILAVPYAPLCSETCKGLCPVCGANRNTTDCTCEPVPPDPRWSVLKNLNPKKS